MRGLMWVVLMVLLSSGAAWAEKAKTVEVWKNLFTLTHGEGIDSNTTFLITKEGVIVVDTRVTPAEARLVKEEVRIQAQQPILYTINTHYHGDHTFGNQVFKDTHTIIAHENVRKALEYESGKEHLEFFKTLKIPGMEETVVTPPNMVFKEKMHVWAGEYHLQLIHMPGHTDGDLFIYIEALKTIIAGDLIFNGKIPYMGDAYVDDWIKALDYIGDLDAEIYIPGHGDPGGKPVLIAMRHYLIDLRRRVKVQIEEGSSLKETQDVVRPILQEKYKNWKKLEWLDANIERAYKEFSVK
ncbi:MAG: MBL fold metallo-hydrolase [Nitrospina sp.]|nr:MBL fold metallo-hydrolase [Nitrospina sp.]